MHGLPEFVYVLFHGKRAAMIVNESGLIRRLPVNRMATDIYRAWPRRQQIDAEQIDIHGNAMVLEDIEVK